MVNQFLITLFSFNQTIYKLWRKRPLAMSCTYDMNDICLPVIIDVQQSNFTPDPKWIAGAFFLGLILGILLAVLCIKLCLKDWEKKKV